MSIQIIHCAFLLIKSNNLWDDPVMLSLMLIKWALIRPIDQQEMQTGTSEGILAMAGIANNLQAYSNKIVYIIGCYCFLCRALRFTAVVSSVTERVSLCAFIISMQKVQIQVDQIFFRCFLHTKYNILWSISLPKIQSCHQNEWHFKIN